MGLRRMEGRLIVDCADVGIELADGLQSYEQGVFKTFALVRHRHHAGPDHDADAHCAEEDGTSHEDEQMLVDAVRQLVSGRRYDVEYPDTRSVAQDQIASDMDTSARDWAGTDYHPSDLHLGKALTLGVNLEVYRTRGL